MQLSISVYVLAVSVSAVVVASSHGQSWPLAMAIHGHWWCKAPGHLLWPPAAMKTVMKSTNKGAAKLVLSDRDREILTALTLKVRILSLVQIASTWWPGQTAQIKTAQRRLRRLAEGGLLLRDRVNVHPILPMDAPLVSWTPGEPPPNFRKLARRIRSRWTMALEPTTVYVASERAAVIFGGFGGRHKHRTQLTHDLHQAELYVRLVRGDPDRACRWVGEEILDQSRDEGKLPDAVIMAPDGRTPEMIYEFSGTYGTNRCRLFDNFCRQKNLAYQLW